MCLRLRVPVLSAVPLPVPLGHRHRRHHGHHHGHRDDEHGGRLRHAELAVHPGQRGPGQLRWPAARHVLVVVDVEVANVQDLTEDAVQLAVTVPRVTWGPQREGSVKTSAPGAAETERVAAVWQRTGTTVEAAAP